MEPSQVSIPTIFATLTGHQRTAAPKAALDLVPSFHRVVISTK